MTEWTLSDRIHTENASTAFTHIAARDVKEFIKLLKEAHREWRGVMDLNGSDSFADEIDKLAGEQLI